LERGGGGRGGGDVPADSDGKGAVVPVAAFDDGHLAVEVAAGAVEDLVGVAVLGGGEAGAAVVVVVVVAVAMVGVVVVGV
jgi:hypothetical protein